MNSLELLVEFVFIAILVVTLVDFLRQRSRIRLDIFLMFACLIVPLLAQQTATALGVTIELLAILAIIAFIVQPILLLRLVQHFQGVPRLVTRLALLGFVATLAVMAVFGEPNPAVATAAPVLYILALEGYSVAAFWRGARQTGGVVQRRLIFAAAGSVFLAVTILLSGLPNFLPATAAPVTELVDLSILLSSVCYFIGFATPRPLRRAWQQAEFYRFLRAPVSAGADPLAAALNHLCVSATRATGGLASQVWLWEAAESRFSLRASDRAMAAPEAALPPGGPVDKAWRERRAVAFKRHKGPGGAPSELAPAAEALVAVPLATRDRAWGVLAVSLRRSSLFPDDDAALLALLADQTAETLEREALYGAERTLLERLAQTNAELQAEVIERRQAEAALAQRTSQVEELARSLEAVIENIPTMLFIKDADELRFVRWNKACEEVVGLARADAVGKNDFDFFPPTEAEFFIAQDRAVLTSGEMLDISEELIHTVHQGVRVLHTRKVPIYDASGAPKYLLGISEDITERRQVEAQIQQLNESLTQRAALLEAANQELEAFSYSVSHDLRSPLRGIDGFSQALLEDYYDQLDDTGKDYLERIRRGAQRMAQLIDDLLRLAWLSRATMSVETVDVSALARTVLGELQAADPERQVETVVADGLTAQADARLLRVGLENLLGNAWKFTGHQTQPRIEVSVGQLGGLPVYCVRDNGAGFDMSTAERLFGAFQRMHSVEEFPGTGIGLAIVQRIMHRHGGRIWAESAPGAGAAFYFMLEAESGV